MYEIKSDRIKTKEKIKVDRYLCGICLNVVLSPRKCSKCPKHFCDLCSSAFIESNSTCPSCKQKLTLKEPEHYLLEDLNELTIICKNNHLGCEEILMYSSLLDHEDVCSYNVVKKIEKTNGFVEKYVSNNFTIIEKKLIVISQELKEIKDNNSISIINLEKKIDSLQEMFFNFISNQKRNESVVSRDFSNQNDENLNQVKGNRIAENYTQIKTSAKQSYDPSLVTNMPSNNKNSFNNSPGERDYPSPKKFQFKVENDQNNFIPNNKAFSNILIKDPKNNIPNSLIESKEIKDKCVFLYFCKGRKKGCKASGDVWGSNPYSCDTDLCRAGIHDGQINENGGMYIIAYGGPYNNFPPSQKFGIMSNSWEASQNTHFVVASISSYRFDTSKFHFDKCGLYIGDCLGKSNGCCQEGVVFGSNPYSHESIICNSALHSGVINSSGGLFAIHAGGQVTKFVGSSNNGITSEKNGFDSTSFLIKSYK